MRSDLKLGEGGTGACRHVDVLANDVQESESTQGAAVRIHEQRNVVTHLNTAVSERYPYESGCFRPERTQPLLSPLTEEPNLRWLIKPNGWKAEVDDLLCPRTGVVQELQERHVATAEPI